MGRLISINGPSFSGKTFLASRLTNEILFNTTYSISNVSFESIYNPRYTFVSMSKDYKDLVRRKLDKFDIVIAESTIIRLNGALHIVCMPLLEEHVKNYNSFKDNFGAYDAIKRSYWNDIIKMRNEFRDLYKIFTGDYQLDMSDDNIDKCYQEVLCYVSDK